MAGTGKYSRGRPQRIEQRQTRQDILQAAAQQFAARGYKMASVRRIAHDADVQPGTIYAHYQNKWGLLRAVLEAVGPGVVIRLSDELRGPGDLPAFCSAVMASWTQPLARLAFSMYLERGQLPTSAHDLQSVAGDLRPEVAQAIQVLRRRVEHWSTLPVPAQELTWHIVFPLLQLRQEQDTPSLLLVQRAYQHGEALRDWISEGHAP